MHQDGVVRIEAPIYGGNFSSDSGAVLPFVLPGELVRLSPDMEILQSSPLRTSPGCVHFGGCGGCHYQHATYPAQLELKRAVLLDLFGQAGLLVLPEVRCISGPAWGYRNRIRLRIESVPGGFEAGYSRRGSNEFLPIRMCPISAPVLWRAAQTILAGTDPLVLRWLLMTSELELFTTSDERHLQLQFLLRSADSVEHDQSSFPALCERILAAIPELAGAAAAMDPDLERRARRRFAGVSWGSPGINYLAAERSYWLPRNAFFQVNRFLIDELVALVTQGQAGELAWDLYAGVGLFTQVLAERFARVVAVEGAQAAIAAMRGTGSSLNRRIETVHSSTLDFLRARLLQRERPSLIVLDPPRAGLGQEGAALLTRIAAERVVYVSCDPTTLTRDLAKLTSIYAIESIHLIDLFPQTFHLETVVHLRKHARS